MPVREIGVQRWADVSWIRLHWTQKFIDSRAGTRLIQHVSPHAAAVNRASRPFISRYQDMLRDDLLLLKSHFAHRHVFRIPKRRVIHVRLLIGNGLCLFVKWVRDS